MNPKLDAILERLLREVMPRSALRLTLTDSMMLHNELGIDSLGLLSLAFRIEEEFQVNLSDYAERLASLQTLGEMRRLIQELEGQP